ncbi:sulfotransferase [Devosia sp.]|uniref:sulfotransferase n=1 Tax=Devosia sp. TaxID=1871048 RepID=UPI00262463F0|nr:sulfotransferase [Devosia sp.]
MPVSAAQLEATVPAERLLVFDVRSGWEPLCAFLGAAIPDMPYPRTNSTREFNERG